MSGDGTDRWIYVVTDIEADGPWPGPYAQVVTIRAATVADVYRLADVVLAATETRGRSSGIDPGERAQWRAGFAEWSRQTIRAADPGNVLSVVMLDGQVIGRTRVVRTVLPGTDTPCLQLAGIQLVPSAQGRGIGTSIIRDLQDAAARDGLPLLIGVEKDNVHARRLYERLGCHLTGETDDEHLLLWRPPRIRP